MEEERTKRNESYFLRKHEQLLPVHNPASNAGPPSFTCLTNMVSIGSKRFLCFPVKRKYSRHVFTSEHFIKKPKFEASKNVC